MENNKPRTIEELFIEKYQKLEEEKKVLEERQEKLLEINNNLGDERDEYKNKFIELVNRLKEDFKPEISETIGSNRPYFRYRHNFILENNVEKDKYYIDLFNLKEEGEEDDE